jgi:(p)ppGpp synthase/HD superfamily hydrolase
MKNLLAFIKPKRTLSEEALVYAFWLHMKTLHFYNNKPYLFHLEMVANNARKYLPLNVDSKTREIVIAAAYLHDAIEDTRTTFNDIVTKFTPICGVEDATSIAELVFAMTNNRGRNRKERSGGDYKPLLLKTPYGAFLKFCDRLANAEYSFKTESSMVKAYTKEHASFMSAFTPLPTDCSSIALKLDSLFVK